MISKRLGLIAIFNILDILMLSPVACFTILSGKIWPYVLDEKIANTIMSFFIVKKFWNKSTNYLSATAKVWCIRFWQVKYFHHRKGQSDPHFKTERPNVRFRYTENILCHIIFYTSTSYKFGPAIAFNYFDWILTLSISTCTTWCSSERYLPRLFLPGSCGLPKVLTGRQTGSLPSPCSLWFCGWPVYWAPISG